MAGKIVSNCSHRFDGFGIDLAGRSRAGAVGFHFILPVNTGKGFSHLAAIRVFDTDKKKSLLRVFRRRPGHNVDLILIPDLKRPLAHPFCAEAAANRKEELPQRRREVGPPQSRARRSAGCREKCRSMNAPVSLRDWETMSMR